MALPALAADPWRTPASGWTENDAKRILQASPWVKPLDGLNANVRWESALPVRLALEKLHPDWPRLNCDFCYAVAVVGMASEGAPPTSTATLKTSGREPVVSIEAHLVKDVLIFVFPRRQDVEEPIVFRLPVGLKLGKTVEFQAPVAGKAVRRTFSLDKMTYEGRLAL